MRTLSFFGAFFICCCFSVQAQAQFYVRGKSHPLAGPFTAGQLLQKGISPGGLVYRKGNTDWQTAGCFPELFPWDGQRSLFAFPAEEADPLYEDTSITLSSWNNDEYLYIQVLNFSDSVSDSRDRSDLFINLLDTHTISRQTVIRYSLNPSPDQPGLHYHLVTDSGTWSDPDGRSFGRGGIRTFSDTNGTMFRIDNYLIPLAEFGKSAGDTLKILYKFYSGNPNVERILTSGHTGENPFMDFLVCPLPPRAHNIYLYDVPEDRDEFRPRRKPLERGVSPRGVVTARGDLAAGKTSSSAGSPTKSFQAQTGKSYDAAWNVTAGWNSASKGTRNIGKSIFGLK